MRARGRGRTQAQVHTLLLPLQQLALLVPTALIAEVVNLDELLPVPQSPPWVLGLLNWRARGVPVVSFDALLGHEHQPATRRAKVVVFYPLEGRESWEYFAVMAVAEPQPRAFSEQDAEALKQAVATNATPYVAASLNLGGELVVIPDLDALRAAFYPSTKPLPG